MDFLPFLVLLLFVVLGGVIAVVADNVGRKLGKKRLKVGRLRPKHTAMLGTFIVGSLISILTIGLVTVASSDVRQWIIEGRRAAEQRDRLIGEMKEVREDLDDQKSQYALLDKDYQAKTSEVNKQAQRLNQLQKQIGTLEPQIATLTRSVDSANKRVRQLDGERAKAQAELASKQKLLAKAQSDLVAVEKQRELQQRLAAEAALDKEETDRRNQELTHQNEQLEKGIASLEQDIRRLERETTDLQAARDKAQDELNDAQQELVRYQTQLIQAERDLQAMLQRLQQTSIEATIFERATNQARREPISYHMGEEITRLAVDSGLSVRQAEDALSSLLRAARFEAISRGAQRTERYMEAGLVERVDPATGQVLTPAMMERQIVNEIVRADQPVVLVALSSLNAFRGEPISLEVEILPNPLVYTKGQTIAEIRVDGSKDEAAVLKQLEELITVRIRERAVEDHMVPNLGSQQFGQIEPVDVFRLMSQVKAANRTVRVQALAAEDTRAGDPLKLLFRIL